MSNSPLPMIKTMDIQSLSKTNTLQWRSQLRVTAKQPEALRSNPSANKYIHRLSRYSTTSTSTYQSTRLIIQPMQSSSAPIGPGGNLYNMKPLA